MTGAAKVLAQLRAVGDATKSAEMAAYHKTAREFLGVPAAVLDEMARELRREITLEARCDLAQEMWATDIHEACIFAAKLLTQARIRPDDAPVWQIIAGWAEGFDSWALADHASIAGAKRLQADPSRLDTVERWTTAENMWTRRAALVMTLPWARLTHPKADDLALRERVLGWAETYVPDRAPYMQKAIAGWLRELSKRDPARVLAFLDGPGAALTKGARSEALQIIQP